MAADSLDGKCTRMLGYTHCKRSAVPGLKTCQPCLDRARRQFRRYQKNPEFKHRHRRYRYGLSLADYEGLLAAQDGRCASCGTDKPGGLKNAFNVDHDHVSGRVRALLCWRCNTLVGRASADVLRAAAAYLDRHATYVRPTAA